MFVKKSKWNELQNKLINKTWEVETEKLYKDFWKRQFGLEAEITRTILDGALMALDTMRQEFILNCEETVKFELENAKK